jgi:hypothetical protein
VRATAATHTAHRWRDRPCAAAHQRQLHGRDLRVAQHAHSRGCGRYQPNARLLSLWTPGRSRPSSCLAVLSRSAGSATHVIASGAKESRLRPGSSRSLRTRRRSGRRVGWRFRFRWTGRSRRARCPQAGAPATRARDRQLMIAVSSRRNSMKSSPRVPRPSSSAAKS